jgi:hypothetical protein
MTRPTIRTPLHPAQCCATCIAWRCDNPKGQAYCGIVAKYLPEDMQTIACDGWELEPRETDAQELFKQLNT